MDGDDCVVCEAQTGAPSPRLLEGVDVARRRPAIVAGAALLTLAACGHEARRAGAS